MGVCCAIVDAVECDNLRRGGYQCAITSLGNHRIGLTRKLGIERYLERIAMNPQRQCRDPGLSQFREPLDVLLDQLRRGTVPFGEAVCSYEI